MKLFAALRKVREYERLELPSLKSLIDFDIVIEVGFAHEEGQPLSLKQLFLMELAPRTTIRRRLAKLVKAGVVIRELHQNDRRTTVLTVSTNGHKTFSRYGRTLSKLWQTCEH
jgi:DNA-binding MarR family transcriptional regulator